MNRFFKNILWATDFTPEAKEALVYADYFARAFGSRITALHVIPDFLPALYADSLNIQKELMGQSETLKKRAQSRIRSQGKKKGISFAKIIVTEGSPPRKIVETAEREKAGLIVIGKKGQSTLERFFIGSVANHVLRHSPVPVLVTRRDRRKPPVRRILVPTDFTKGEDLERDAALKLAKKFGASLTLLYVLELFGHEFRMVDDMFKSVEAKLKRRQRKGRKGVAVSEEVTRAINASAGIVDYARTHQSDLIVMLTCASRLGRFFLGSTTEKVISSSSLPVLVIPPKWC